MVVAASCRNMRMCVTVELERRRQLAVGLIPEFEAELEGVPEVVIGGGDRSKLLLGYGAMFSGSCQQAMTRQCAPRVHVSLSIFAHAPSQQCRDYICQSPVHPEEDGRRDLHRSF